MTATQNGRAEKFTADPLAKRSVLFDGSGNEIHSTGTHSAGAPDPFFNSYLDGVARWFSRHGPALGKIFLILASGTATVYNAVAAGGLEMVVAGMGGVLTACVIFTGMIVEGGFAYAWAKQGSTDLAGPQISINVRIFKWSRFSMMLDIILTLSTLVFGLADFGVYWMMFGQPVVAVRVVSLYFDLKGSHPMTKALQQEATYNAYMLAAGVWDRVQTMKLEHMDRNHQRKIEESAIRIKQEEGMKYVLGRRFRKEVRGIVTGAISGALSKFKKQTAEDKTNPYVRIIGEGRPSKKA